MANLEDAGRRSQERAAYTGLKLRVDQYWRKLEPWSPLLVVVALLGIWEWLGRAGLISSLFFPVPTVIFSTLVELFANGKMLPNLAATISRLLVGCLLGCIPGLVVGLCMGWSPRLRALADPIVAILHPIPKIAIFPLILIIFGLGETSKIVAIAIAAFFPMLLNSMVGVRQLNPVYFEVTRNYGANRWKTFTRVILPGSLPMVLTGLRISINIALVITIAVELTAAKSGLGMMIWFAWQTLRIEDMYATLIVIGLLGAFTSLALQRFSHQLAPWQDQPLEQ